MKYESQGLHGQTQMILTELKLECQNRIRKHPCKNISNFLVELWEPCQKLMLYGGLGIHIDRCITNKIEVL